MHICDKRNHGCLSRALHISHGLFYVIKGRDADIIFPFWQAKHYLRSFMSGFSLKSLSMELSAYEMFSSSYSVSQLSFLFLYFSLPSFLSKVLAGTSATNWGPWSLQRNGALMTMITNCRGIQYHPQSMLFEEVARQL